jgi:hypothetical protein
MIGRRIQDENAYFRREYCIQELMWAKNAGKFIQPICRQKDKDRVGDFPSSGLMFVVDHNV